MTATTTTRWLTEAEKQSELERYGAYREDPSAWRRSHPEAKGGEGYIDHEVLPLVDALNALPGVCTVQSCCGHRWPVPGDPHGAERVYTGQLWLRLSEAVMRASDERVGDLLAAPGVGYVQRIYAYKTMKEPHEIFDVQWEPDDFEAAAVSILLFFEQAAGLDEEERWRWLDRCPGCGSTDCGCLARRVPIGPSGRGALAVPDPYVSDEYARAYEAGALAALEHITDQRPDLEDVTMVTAEHIGREIDLMLGRGEATRTDDQQRPAEGGQH